MKDKAIQQHNGEHEMKIVMETVMCGPNGNAFKGTVLDKPEAEAKELIEGRFARPYNQQTDHKLKQHGLIRAER